MININTTNISQYSGLCHDESIINLIHEKDQNDNFCGRGHLNIGLQIVENLNIAAIDMISMAKDLSKQRASP